MISVSFVAKKKKKNLKISQSKKNTLVKEIASVFHSWTYKTETDTNLAGVQNLIPLRLFTMVFSLKSSINILNN